MRGFVIHFTYNSHICTRVVWNSKAKAGRSVGLKLQAGEFKSNDDDFNLWIERFELYILLNKIMFVRRNYCF